MSTPSGHGCPRPHALFPRFRGKSFDHGRPPRWPPEYRARKTDLGLGWFSFLINDITCEQAQIFGALRAQLTKTLCLVPDWVVKFQFRFCRSIFSLSIAFWVLPTQVPVSEAQVPVSDRKEGEIWRKMQKAMLWAVVQIAFTHIVRTQACAGRRNHAYHPPKYLCKWTPRTIFMTCIAKSLAPYRIGKRPHKQNRAKIHLKYRKSYFLSIFNVFLGYFEGCYVFLSCRGPSLSQDM